MTAPLEPALVGRFASDFVEVFGRTPSAAAPFAVAVSGGPDSMALLALAASAWPGAVIAATVDHGLRASAAGECAMVADVCAGLGVRHATLAGAVPAGASLQAQARALRYKLLVDWAVREGAATLATAHQADDQAETFLMRATRGAGLSGLAGVRSSRVIDGTDLLLVRPLLDWRRAELRAIVRRAGLPFVDDPANDDPRHDRTRFRRLLNEHEWLDTPHIARSVLPVTVGNQHPLTLRGADAALHRGAIALVVRVPDHARAGRRRGPRGVVARPVVDDDHFPPGRGAAERRDDLADDGAFVVGRNHHADGGGISHGSRADR